MKKNMHIGLVMVAIAVGLVWGLPAPAQDLEMQPPEEQVQDYDGPPLNPPAEEAPAEELGDVGELVPEPTPEPVNEPEPYVEAAPMDIPPVEVAPVETAPAEIPPLEESPIEMPAVEAAPAEAPAVEAAPVEAPAPDEIVPAATDAPAEAAPAETAAPAEAKPTAELIELETETEAAVGGEVARAGEQTDLITVTLDNVPLQDVIKMFTRISGANIVAGTNLQGSVTVNLQDVEWKPALQVILDSANLVLVEKSPGIYAVMSKSDLAAEPVTMDTVYLKYATVTNILPIVQKMLVSSNASVAGFPAANAVVIQETAARLAVIKDMINRIDRPRPQVFIEAKFVELNDQAIKDIGVNWQALQGYTVRAGSLTWGVTEERDSVSSRGDRLSQWDRRNNVDVVNQRYDIDNQIYEESETTYVEGPPGSFTPTTKTTPTRTVEDTIDTGLDITKDIEDTFTKTVTDVRAAVLSADEFALTLSALKQNTGVEVVSNPRIVVASGETASIHVGRNEPNIVATLKEQSGGGGGLAANQYVYSLDTGNPFIQIGVKVAVTPTVNTESNITVKITPELSRKLGDKSAGDAAISFPITQNRKIQTEFNLESGRTVAIGGLTSTEDREQVSKIPILGDIPIIGKYLFRHTHTEKVQDEVIIFVTVGLASAEALTSSAGIPSEGRLIHRKMAREAAQADVNAAAMQQGKESKKKK